MKKLFLMGRSEAGKTSLTQALKGEELHYEKTQYTITADDTIDSPGEYAESKQFGAGLACFSFEADVVGIVQAADEPYNLFSPCLRTFILRPLIGIITKTDSPYANVPMIKQWLLNAGCDRIFPFPMSIYDNIAYGPRTHGIRSKAKLDDIVEKSLRNAAIWDECKDRLKKSALGMSGGQQQRLCIARALAVEPEVLLMDEPTSALDPISTSKIEDLAMELKKDYTIVMVTHNMQQAVRVSDNTAFFLLGEVIEYNNTEKLFSIPSDKRTEDYITGRFG